MLKVDLLGQVRAELSTGEIDLGPGRQRAIFAVLADRHGHHVTRDELIAHVWGSAPPASVGGSVHTYISGLRRALEPDRPPWAGGELLVLEPAGYRLRLQPENLDIVTFHRLRDLAAQREAAGDTEGAVSYLDAALVLWRGEAFGGVTGPLAEERRAELAEERVVTIERRIWNLLALGIGNELVPELEALAQEHPLRESMWEALITALYRSGRRTEALDHIAQLRSSLRESIGVEPGPAIRQLQQKLLVDEQEAVDSGSRESVTPKVFSTLPPAPDVKQLVGRDRELTRLRAYVGNLRTRRGQSLLVEGPRGIGKTALLLEVLAGVDQSSHHLAWARSSLPAALGFDPQGTTTNDLIKRAEQLCSSAPLVLAVDDLHEADDESLVAWDQLCVAARRLPMLLIATCRTDDRVLLAQLRRSMAVRDDLMLHLRPLNKPAATALAQQVAGSMPDAALREIADRSAGIPLVLLETITKLPVSGDITPQQALLASIEARIDRLSPDTVDLLRCAAVLRARATVDEIAAVLSKRPSDLLPALEEALQAKLLVKVGQSLALTRAQRDAIHAATPLQVLTELHRQAARREPTSRIRAATDNDYTERS